MKTELLWEQGSSVTDINWNFPPTNAGNAFRKCTKSRWAVTTDRGGKICDKSIRTSSKSYENLRDINRELEARCIKWQQLVFVFDRYWKVQGKVDGGERFDSELRTTQRQRVSRRKHLECWRKAWPFSSKVEHKLQRSANLLSVESKARTRARVRRPNNSPKPDLLSSRHQRWQSIQHHKQLFLRFVYKTRKSHLKKDFVYARRNVFDDFGPQKDHKTFPL